MPDTNAAGQLASTALGTAVPVAGLALGAVQAGIGIAKEIKANKAINSLLDKREPFQTSQQVYDILNATLNQAQGDTATRDFEIGQIDQNLSNSLGTATRLGANPNDLSSLFQQSLNGVMQVGNEFHKSNTQQFSNVLNAFKLLGDNKDAESASKQDIIKDRLAAEGVNLQTAAKNTSGGLNTILSSLSSKAIGDQYNTKNDTTSSNTLESMINDLLFKKQVQSQLSGPITNADMFGSAVPNSNLLTTG